MSRKIRLEAAGYFTDDGTELADGAVYERPVMLVYTGKFESMDGPVEIAPEHILHLEKTHNSFLSKVKRLATGEVPMKDCPPLQLDHSTSATHTVGRLVGELKSASVNIDGEDRLALYGMCRFLGRENVEKAKDGRWTHVSIGADLESGRLNELSVTPFPAAPKASLLCRLGSHKGVQYEVVEIEPGEYDIVIGGQKVSHHAGTADEVDSEAKRYIDHEKKEIGMHEKLKKHLMEHRKMSEQDAEKLSQDITKHQMSKMEKDDASMFKHMSEADDKEMSRMADEHDEHLKHLAAKDGESAGEKEDGEKKMARKTDFLKLAKGLKDSNVQLKVELRKSTIAARLARFRTEGKVTPAEIKKIDIAKLSGLSDEAVEAAMATFDNREAVIKFGSMTGTSKAEDIEKITKKYRLAKMELESRMNMPSKRAEAEKQLKKLDEDEKVELAKVGGGDEESPSKGMLSKLGYDDLVSMLDDKKRHEELKRHLKHMMDHYGEEHSEEGSDKHMSALAKKQTELQNQLDELISLASPALGISLEELK